MARDPRRHLVPRVGGLRLPAPVRGLQDRSRRQRRALPPSPLAILAFAGSTLRRALFSEILKVGVPRFVNGVVTNLPVVLLNGIAGRLGREVAVGYAMGARLEHVLIPPLNG